MSDKNIQNTIRENLRRLIDKDTRENIARGIGCDTSMVTKHYNGDRSITAEYIAKYSEYFNVSPNYLFGFEGTSSEDERVQFVSQYTGLSDDVVRKLHHMITSEDLIFYTENNCYFIQAEVIRFFIKLIEKTISTDMAVCFDHYAFALYNRVRDKQEHELDDFNEKLFMENEEIAIFWIQQKIVGLLKEHGEKELINSHYIEWSREREKENDEFEKLWREGKIYYE